MVPTIRPLRQWLTHLHESERRVIARYWALPIEVASSPDDLAQALLTPAAVTRMLEMLGPDERRALEAVQAYSGEIPVLIMEREFGRLRVPDS